MRFGAIGCFISLLLLATHSSAGLRLHKTCNHAKSISLTPKCVDIGSWMCTWTGRRRRKWLTRSISIICVCVCVLCVEVSTESDFMSSADITLPTVFQTAKVLQTIHMGESRARHKSGDVFFFLLFFQNKHRIDCGGD